jgi:hypothetical protein
MVTGEENVSKVIIMVGLRPHWIGFVPYLEFSGVFLVFMTFYMFQCILIGNFGYIESTSPIIYTVTILQCFLFSMDVPEKNRYINSTT